MYFLYRITVAGLRQAPNPFTASESFSKNPLRNTFGYAIMASILLIPDRAYRHDIMEVCS